MRMGGRTAPRAPAVAWSEGRCGRSPASSGNWQGSAGQHGRTGPRRIVGCAGGRSTPRVEPHAGGRSPASSSKSRSISEWRFISSVPGFQRISAMALPPFCVQLLHSVAAARLPAADMGSNPVAALARRLGAATQLVADAPQPPCLRLSDLGETDHERPDRHQNRKEEDGDRRVGDGDERDDDRRHSADEVQPPVTVMSEMSITHGSRIEPGSHRAGPPSSTV
jgi:hypothetical protein